MEKQPSPSTKPTIQSGVISLSCWFSAPIGLSLSIPSRLGLVPVGFSGFPAYSRMLSVALLPHRATNVCHLRTVIVTAAVYRGLASVLRAEALTAPRNLPAPGRRQPLYVVFRLSRDLCFW